MKSKIESINIIGSGNMAYTLYSALQNKIEIAGIFSRSELKWNLKPKAKIFREISELSKKVGLNIICVSDDAIGEVAGQLASGVPVVHTSGAIALNAISSFSNHGVIYPLQTLSKERKIDLKHVPFFIESNTPEFDVILQKFCLENLSDNVISISSEQRLNVHLAGVFANNFTTFLIGEARAIFEKNKLNPDLLMPLLQETINKINELGYSHSQTGPARRGDKITAQKHKDILKDSEMQKIYTLLSEAIAKKFKT